MSEDFCPLCWVLANKSRPLELIMFGLFRRDVNPDLEVLERECCAEHGEAVRVERARLLGLVLGLVSEGKVAP